MYCLCEFIVLCIAKYYPKDISLYYHDCDKHTNPNAEGYTGILYSFDYFKGRDICFGYYSRVEKGRIAGGRRYAVPFVNEVKK